MYIVTEEHEYLIDLRIFATEKIYGKFSSCCFDDDCQYVLIICFDISYLSLMSLVKGLFLDVEDQCNSCLVAWKINKKKKDAT